MPVVTERLINRPVWFDLSTSDLTAAKGLPAAAVAPKMPGQEAAPVTWTVHLGVTDADATLARITAHGGTMMVPPMAIPPDLGRMTVAVDAGGAVFGLWERGAMCWTTENPPWPA